MIDLTFTTKLKYSIGPADDKIDFEDNASICEQLATPSHIFATIYTSANSEVVLIYACEDGVPCVQRGAENTDACPFPLGACVKINQIIDGAVCEPATNVCECPSVWDQLNLGKGLDIDSSQPDFPALRVTPTGVAEQEICGARINSCGQFTYVPPNWPASCIPVFAPCCGDDAVGGGNNDACDVSYSPQFGAPYATATTVCEVIIQLEDALATISGAVASGAGVDSVTAGDCITITGTSTDPIVSVSPTGISPGSYAGFEVNACGQVVNYTSPTVPQVSVTGVAPIQVSYDIPNMEYEVSILGATEEQCGCVTLADIGAISEPNNAPAAGGAVTFEFLEAYLLDKGLI